MTFQPDLPHCPGRPARSGSRVFLATTALSMALAIAAPAASRAQQHAVTQHGPGEERPTDSPIDAETATPAAPSLLPSGALVFVDPATGRILERPRPEQLQALRALRVEQAARASAAEDRQRLLDSLPIFQVPGGFGVDVEGLFESSLIVERGADGSLVVLCAEATHDGHDHTVAARPAPAAPPEL
ncbi:MAG TPA: hypothetical protein VNB06_19995 [Thermoanaerobaculia bacterium]|nr:hypothetical protein [Thermoanaerobaculia bacterium]